MPASNLRRSETAEMRGLRNIVGPVGYRPTVRKALIGWWVDGEWCPTRKIRDHRVAKLTVEAQ